MKPSLLALLMVLGCGGASFDPFVGEEDGGDDSEAAADALPDRLFSERVDSAPPDAVADVDPCSLCTCNGENELCPDEENHCRGEPLKSCCACPTACASPEPSCIFYPTSGMWCCP